MQFGQTLFAQKELFVIVLQIMFAQMKLQN